MAHTKGEWTLRGPAQSDGADDYAIVANGQIIAETFGRTNVDNYEPSLDNARLIAVAPKLLTVCKAAESALRSYQYGNSSPELAEEIANGIRAVVVEAEGAK